MSNNTSYSGIEVERRVGDHRQKIKYNKTTDDQGHRDYYSKLNMDASSKKVQIGKSNNSSSWNIRNIDGENETSTTSPFASHSYQTVLSDFGIDAKAVFKPSSSGKSLPAKKKLKPPVKKKSKPSVKKKSKSSAKGGAKKKSKKKSKKKKSKKKKSK